MFVATVIVPVLLAALLTFAAIRKLSHDEQVVEEYAMAGVPEDKLNLLATTLLGASVGLIAGLLWAPVGVVAAGGLVVYFIVACGFHIRAHDTENLPTPVVMALLAAAALILRLATL